MILKHKYTLLIIAVAVIVRFGLLIGFSNIFAFEKTGVVQGFTVYDVLAQNLIKTRVFGQYLGKPDAAVPPLYPVLLSGIYALLGRGSVQAVLLNTLFDITTIICVIYIAKNLLPQAPTAGYIAAFLFAVYPYFVFQSLTVIDTSLFAALVHVFTLTMIYLRRRTSLDRVAIGLIALGGLILGLAALDRAVVAAMGVAVFFWFLFNLGLLDSLKRLIPVAVISLLVIIPWDVRNYQVFHTFVNVATTEGMNFWFGNSQYTIPFFRAGYHTQWAAAEKPPTPLNDQQADNWMMDQALTYLKQNPGKIPELLWVKFLAYWSIDVFPSKNPVSGASPIGNYQGSALMTVDQQGNIVINGVPTQDAVTAYSQPLFDQLGRAVHIIYFGSLLILGLIGVALTLPYWREVSLIWFIQIAMTLVYMIFVTSTRYRVPTDSLLFIFSAYTLLKIWAFIRNRRGSPSPVLAPPIPG